jgi:hypothetical protein
MLHVDHIHISPVCQRRARRCAAARPIGSDATLRPEFNPLDARTAAAAAMCLKPLATAVVGDGSRAKRATPLGPAVAPVTPGPGRQGGELPLVLPGCCKEKRPANPAPVGIATLRAALVANTRGSGGMMQVTR